MPYGIYSTTKHPASAATSWPPKRAFPFWAVFIKLRCLCCWFLGPLANVTCDFDEWSRNTSQWFHLANFTFFLDASPERGVHTAEFSSRSPSPRLTYRRSKANANSSAFEHLRLSRAEIRVARSSDDENEQFNYFEDSRPEELYNLIKLAEVCSATAAGQILCKRYCYNSDYEVVILFCDCSITLAVFRIGRNRNSLKIYREIRRDERNMRVPIATNATAPAVIWRDIDKRIVRWLIKKRGVALIVKRFMYQCQRLLCTSVRIIRAVGAPTAGNAFLGLGCFKDTLGPILVGILFVSVAFKNSKVIFRREAIQMYYLRQSICR